MNLNRLKEMLEWEYNLKSVIINPVVSQNTGMHSSRLYEVISSDRAYICKESPAARKEILKKMHTVCKHVAIRGVNALRAKKTVAGETVAEKDLFLYELFDSFGITPTNRIDYAAETDKAVVLAGQFAALYSLSGDSLSSTIEFRDPFSETLKERLLLMAAEYGFHRRVSSVIKHLSEVLEPYLPYLNINISHGDLHPDNIIWSKKGDPFFIDWEFCDINYDLFDLAFITGCVGMDHPDNLTGTWVKQLFTSFSGKTVITKLSLDTFYDLVIATRLLWLDEWFKENDGEMISLECDYLDLLIGKRGDIRDCWSTWLYKKEEKQEKWVIQDAVFDNETKKLKETVLSQYIKILPAFQDVFPHSTQECAERIRTLIIAFGKDNDLLRIIDMIHLQQQCHKTDSQSRDLAAELAFTCANASLDFAKHHQRQGYAMLLEYIRELQDNFSGDPEVTTAYSFILRNYSILLSELGQHKESFRIIDTLVKLSENNREMFGITEELARALSSGVITALKVKDVERLESYYRTLVQLQNKYRDSAKIHGAFKFARKNIKKAGIHV